MKTNKLRFIAAVTASTNLFGGISPVYAHINVGEIKHQVESKQAEYHDIISNISELHLEIDVILDEIIIIMAKIEETDAKITVDESRKKQIEKEIIIKELELAKKQKEYGERLRGIYKQGDTSIMQVILGSDSLGDLASRVDAMIKIAEIDKTMLEKIDSMKIELEGKKIILQEEIAALDALNFENNKNLVEVEDKKNEATIKLMEMEVEEAKIEKDLALIEGLLISDSVEIINDTSNTNDQLLKAISELMKLRPKVILSSTDDKIAELIKKARTTIEKRKTIESVHAPMIETSATRSMILNYAYKFLGVPYLWGGTTPDGFDCSGFTKYVYQHFGINLPRVSRDQAKAVIAVPFSEAMPGDLIYFGQDHVTHIGIFIGSNQMIHAPSPGKTIRTTDLSWHLNNYSIVGIRRIISD